MHLSICNITIPPGGMPRAFDTLPFPGSRAFDKSAAGVGNLTEQGIASVTEWLTKNRLQKLRDAFELNYKIPFCNFNMKKGQMVLTAYYWFSAARLATGSRKFDHMTPILRQLHWLPVR